MCPQCGSYETKKNGIVRDKQQYRCNGCTHQFVNQKRNWNHSKQTDVWLDFVFHKLTVRELCVKYNKDKRTIRTALETYIPPGKIHDPRPVHIVVDATYFGERTEGTSWCVLVARDHENSEDLVWLFADTESTSAYADLRTQLEDADYTILSVTGDGFSGIKTAFSGIPYQMCCVHMERIVIRGTTRKPQTEAGIVLLALVHTLHDKKINKKLFLERLRLYMEKYNDFLNERTTNPITNETFWTHKNLRKAVLSLIAHTPDLFTYKGNTHIAKTTNSLEGHFSHINEVTAIHRGLSKDQKQKMIQTILLTSTISPTPESLKTIFK